MIDWDRLVSVGRDRETNWLKSRPRTDMISRFQIHTQYQVRSWLWEVAARLKASTHDWIAKGQSWVRFPAPSKTFFRNTLEQTFLPAGSLLGLAIEMSARVLASRGSPNILSYFYEVFWIRVVVGPNMLKLQYTHGWGINPKGQSIVVYGVNL